MTPVEGKHKTKAELIRELQVLRDQALADKTKIARLLSQSTVIRKINQLLLRAKSQPELFQQICDLLKQIEYIKFVWIGLTEKGSFEVKPVAQAGFEEDYLSSIKVTWDDSEYGRGPTGTAIKTGQPFVMRDIENDPRYQPWRKEALKRGYASSIALPLVHERESIGALNVYSERKDAFGDEEVELLMEVAEDIAVGIKSLRLEKELEQAYGKLRRAMEGTIQALSTTVEMRDPYTAGHQRRVTELACAVAREMGLQEKRTEGIYIAGLLHDIGKIAVPAEILSKPGTISEGEFTIMKSHPRVGFEILKGIKFPWPVAQIILQHHERMDGSGYPSGLSGEEIYLEARILGVADVVEAMASHRPYRPALGIDKALQEISQNSGPLYDPKVVDACLTLFNQKGFSFVD